LADHVLIIVLNLSTAEAEAGLKATIKETFTESHQHLRDRALQIIERIDKASPKDPEGVLSAIQEAHKFHHDALADLGALNFSTISTKTTLDTFNFTIKKDEKNPKRSSVVLSWPAKYGNNFLNAVMHIMQALRDADEEPGLWDFVVGNDLMENYRFTI
jgi:hypothetical protein